MKNAILNFKLLVMVLGAVMLFSCSAEDGEDGAIGPQGPAGIDGVDGANGQDGEDGNANVTSVLLENQTISNGDTVFDVPQLTQAIYDTGIVYAYVTVTGNNYWEVLPLSLGGQIILEIDKIEIGSITLKANFTQSNLRLRFVFVEGNLTGKTIIENIKKMSYEEAMDYFGLEY
ncbi:collagen-like protein [Maribacter sp. 2210JD10-5]|uniref:collagen-like triple helix repeat-containing protein n=1 Tax=Maribacter sp. 2210JD10-5 TaxID=3386272 RepID=UPI0039BC4A7A